MSRSVNSNKNMTALRMAKAEVVDAEEELHVVQSEFQNAEGAPKPRGGKRRIVKSTNYGARRALQKVLCRALLYRAQYIGPYYVGPYYYYVGPNI